MRSDIAGTAVMEPGAPSDRRSLSGNDAADAAAARASRARLAIVAALLIGTLLRLAQYAVNRSLWLDEGLLVSNFLNRSWAGLFEPFHRGQTAPLGFLALVKGTVALLGRSEYALRLVPLVAGLATLPVLPRIARRYLTRGALPLGIALVALAPYLVYYSSEVKQYALDALISLFVLALARAAARRPGDARTAAAYLGFGCVALWFSQPAAFMLGGTGLVLGIRALRRRDGRALGLLAATAAAWAVSFAGAFLYARHQLEDPEYMRAFWHYGFFPLPPRTLWEWTWLPRMAARAFREPMGVMGMDESAFSVVATAGAMLLFALGFAWMARHRRLRLGLLLAPAGLALGASAAHVYPFGGEFLAGGRVLVFLLPSLAFVMAEGAAALRRWLPGGAGRAAFAAGAALALLPAGAYAALSVPHLRAEVKPLLEWVNENRRPGDVMYVYYNGQSVFEYYAPRYGWNRTNTVAGICSRFHPERYLDDLARLRGRRRVWVLVVSGASVRGFEEDRVIVGFLDHIGRRLDDRVTVGARMYLYDLAPGGPPPGPYRLAVPPFAPDPAMDCRGAWEPLNQTALNGERLVEAVAETAGEVFEYSGEELDSLGEARNYYGWISAQFAPWLGARMVEAGAGIGTFTEYLLRHRPDARITAVEPAANNFPRLAQRWAGDGRVTPVQGYLDGSLPAASADAVVAVNVLEHVEDDAGFVADAARMLVPGGHLCLFVPALPLLYGSLDREFEHFRRYTRTTLEARLRGAGLEPVRLRYMNLPGILAWFLWSRVLRRRTITARDANTYDRWVLPVVRAVEEWVPPPVGNSLLAVARKP